jgi:Ca2+-binding EF-hand superfamily protein
MEKLVDANMDEGTMELARKQALRAAFEEFDADKSGALCFDEVTLHFSYRFMYL